MGYSARRGFSSGSMKSSSGQRQAEMQQRLAKMQEIMNAAQTEVEAKSFTASVGGGAVEAVVNGKKEVLSLNIKPEAVDPEDVEMLQDLVVSAVNEALRQASDAMEKAVSNATGGLDLSGFGL
ncbi:MAG: YbaB/EbfC family nucleoid-associated protein [Oscillibacter sp.]|nr:YbaB/EbfC family nucleoid-associated protein [Oscillibacter sp.]